MAEKKNKSAFIRDLLKKGASPSDIIAKGKAAGLKLSAPLVYKVRGREGLSKKGSGGRSPATPGKMSASDFVRSVPNTTPAADVVAAGAKKGIRFSANLVYAIRAKKKASLSQSPKQNAPLGGTADSLAQSFQRIALDVGLDRARYLLEDLERRLSEILTA